MATTTNQTTTAIGTFTPKAGNVPRSPMFFHGTVQFGGKTLEADATRRNGTLIVRSPGELYLKLERPNQLETCLSLTEATWKSADGKVLTTRSPKQQLFADFRGWGNDCVLSLVREKPVYKAAVADLTASAETDDNLPF